MSPPNNKTLLLGTLAGMAGVSLFVAFYHRIKSKRRTEPQGSQLATKNQGGSALKALDGPGGTCSQDEVLIRLEALLQCVSELKDEMKALKNTLPTLQDHVRAEFRGEQNSASHRTTVFRRKRPTSSTSRTENFSSEEAESEGGYITAVTDSDEEDEITTEHRKEELITDKLSLLLHEIDGLHEGSESDKRESLNILLKHCEEFGQDSEYLWRLTRAHCDLHDISSTQIQKKQHAEMGKCAGEKAVTINPTCAESHQWYAIMCGIMAEYDTIQNKIKNGYIFKDHLDKAIELKPRDPLLYYLLGRWCYAVSQLSWVERKVATTLFGEPPVATVDDALRNFLKVEELRPAYSRLNYVFLAKCYKDMGQKEKAKSMCEAASSMSSDFSKEDEEAKKELEGLLPALGL